MPNENDRALDRPAITGRDEMNLAEFSFTVLSRSTPKDVKTLTFTDNFTDRNGNLVVRSWTIAATDKFGLPTAVDEELCMALLQLTKEKTDFQERQVFFTKYELVRLMGWPDNGESYRRIKEGLDRLSGVRIIAEDSFFDIKKKKYVTDNFGIVSHYHLYGEEKGTPDPNHEGMSYFEWDGMFFDSLRSGYIKQLDTRFYFSLERPISKRLFRFLDKRFFKQSTVKIRLSLLAHEKLGMSRNRHWPAQIKQKLDPAIVELVQKGFLDPRTHHEKRGREEWIIFTRAPKKLHSVPQKAPQDGQTRLIQQLTTRGVAKNVAADVIAHIREETIKEKIEVFDWLLDKNDAKVSQNPPGYLVMSITNNYPTPKGFVSKEEATRKAELKAKKEAERAKEQQEKKEKARLRQEQINKAWQSLSPEEREEIKQRAVDKLPPFLRDAYERTIAEGKPLGAALRPMLQGHINEIILERLQLDLDET